jgi:hypothetical protein
MSAVFKEFKVVWQQKPYAYKPKKVVFVKAHNEVDAKILAENHIERQGLEKSEFGIVAATEVVSLPPGEVISG